MGQQRSAGRRAPSAFLLGAALAGLALLAPAILDSCQGKPAVSAVRREQQFTLGYGPGDDQIDLFQLENSGSPLKTRIAMREGIFYVANGNGAKVVRFSSFGDLLSMIYNPDKNPEPKSIQAPSGERSSAKSGAGAAPSPTPGRRAVAYPFRAVGEIAVDSNQGLFVEDRLPPERRVQDKDSGAFLDYVVLRFGKDGQFIDYLGQEGVGGTPFPYLVGLYATPSDECVVISVTQTAWLVHWFDARGLVVSSLRLRRDALPLPEKGAGLIASLDRIVPDPEGRSLLVKIDYYREAVDPATKSGSGIEYSSSWAYRMDIRGATYPERWEIPAIERTAKTGQNGETVRYVRVPEFIGASGRELFFLTADDDGKTYLATFDRSSRGMARYYIDIAPDELYYNSYFLSKEGILCALLGTKYEARVVYWRFDALIKGKAGGGSK
jgi:hypothetical protein